MFGWGRLPRVLLLCVLPATGCSSASGPSGRTEVANVRQDYSSLPQERTIPFRVIQIVQLPGDPDTVALGTLQNRIQDANEVFKPAGIQFWLRSTQRWTSPIFSDLTGNPVVPWSQIKTDVHALFPALPLDAWQDTKQLDLRRWLRVIGTRRATLTPLMNSDVILWFPQTLGGGYQGFHPEWGTAASLLQAGIPKGKFVHEMGHVFGLHHPWDQPWSSTISDSAKLYDPESLEQVEPEEFWDLVYLSGSPNTFFGSRADAHPFNRYLQPILSSCGGGGCNCSLQPDGFMTCSLGRSQYQSGNPALKGLSIPLMSGYASNAASYFDLTSVTHSFAISDSQIETIRRYLRFELPTPEPWRGEIMGQANNAYDPGSMRPRLGEGHNREANFQLDFDGDGRRDIGTWTPPTDAFSYGTFTVLLSTYGHSVSPGQFMSVAFGKLGDIPVVADYNNDGRADVAVFQPGGGQFRNDPASADGWWRWCISASPNPVGTTCGHDGQAGSPLQFGSRDSVPLPGLDFDGNALTSELAIFRSVTGDWTWRLVSGAPNYLALGLGASSVPLPGLYDGDAKTDIAAYDPRTATFRMARSELNWGAPEVSAQFPSIYTPMLDQNVGSQYAGQRGAAIALTGVNRNLNGNPRRVFSIWFPAYGQWVTKWDIFSASNPIACQWGLDIDVPIVNIDSDGDAYTDMVVFRGKTYTGNGQISVKSSNGGSQYCDGSEFTNYYTGLGRPRNMVFAVADMTGDGKPEIMFVDPDTLTIRWFTSESNYTISSARTLGNAAAIVL